MNSISHGQRDDSSKVYKPSKSSGQAWLIAIGLFSLAVAGYTLVMLISYGPPEAAAITIPVAVIMAVIAAVFFVMASWIPSMRYELNSEKLVMRCGPLRYNIALAEITRVTKTDLALSLWSAMRLPGFALGTVPYAGTGNVIMCATRSLKGIILIETAKKKYGLTPQDEKAFLEELDRYLQAGQ